MDIDDIRGLVRPVVTFVVAATMATIVIILVVKFGSEEMAKTALTAFIAVSGTVIAFWFASRKSSS